MAIPFGSPWFWLAAVIGVLAVGIAAGSYPAFFLSRFKPIDTISGKLSKGGGNLGLRNGLVVFQFLIAAILIVATLGIQRQMDFVQNKKLGFDREQVLIIEDAYALSNNTRAYKQRIKAHPDVKSASFSGYLPVPSNRSDSPLCGSAELREDNCVAMQIWDIDEDYIQTMGMEIAEGRNFIADMQTDSQAVIINETALELFGFDDPIGKTIYGSRTNNNTGGFDMIPLKIIGLVKDFHYESLRENIRALSFVLRPSTSSLSIKLDASNLDEFIGFAERNWKELAPGQPFAYSFMDESFNRMYQTELRVGKIFNLFSGLGIFIACLGLFGLAAFATERRTREIGIRKVLGASTFGIVSLLSKDFLRLVILALICAMPVSWYLLNQWLTNFAYKVEMNIWMFVVASLMAILIAVITVSFHSVKSALSNPVESIRME